MQGVAPAVGRRLSRLAGGEASAGRPQALATSSRLRIRSSTPCVDADSMSSSALVAAMSSRIPATTVAGPPTIALLGIASAAARSGSTSASATLGTGRAGSSGWTAA